MKKQVYTVITLIVLVGALTVAAHAQTSSRQELHASIPFAFQVGNVTLPAGVYAITQINPSAPGVVLRFRSSDSNSIALVQLDSTSGKAQKQQLVFHRYGDRYFLAQVWTGSVNSGLEASPSKAERALRKELASNRLATETVAMSRRQAR